MKELFFIYFLFPLFGLAQNNNFNREEQVSRNVYKTLSPFSFTLHNHHFKFLKMDTNLVFNQKKKILFKGIGFNEDTMAVLCIYDKKNNSYFPYPVLTNGYVQQKITYYPKSDKITLSDRKTLWTHQPHSLNNEELTLVKDFGFVSIPKNHQKIIFDSLQLVFKHDTLKFVPSNKKVDKNIKKLIEYTVYNYTSNTHEDFYVNISHHSTIDVQIFSNGEIIHHLYYKDIFEQNILLLHHYLQVKTIN